MLNLPAAEGYEESTDEEGQTTRTVKDESGSLISLQLEPDGSILDLEIPDPGESGEEESEGEPNATHAARQKAEQMGVALSRIEGSVAEGRITIKDVVSAANGG